MKSLTGELCFEDEEVEEIERPRTRGDCVNGPRPCPYVSCKYSLLLSVSDRGDLTSNHVARRGGERTLYAANDAADVAEGWINNAVDALFEMEDTCALDVAERGEHAVPELAKLLGIDKRSAFILKRKALDSFARVAEETGVDQELREAVEERGGDHWETNQINIEPETDIDLLITARPRQLR